MAIQEIITHIVDSNDRGYIVNEPDSVIIIIGSQDIISPVRRLDNPLQPLSNHISMN